MNILITGASGFIGSFLCEESLKLRYTVWAGIRKTSSRKWLQNEWLKFAILDMANKDILYKQLYNHKKNNSRWDVIIHAGGATKCLHKEDFIKNNFECTKNLIETLEELDMMPKQFIYLSSLSVLGPGLDENNPEPNTAYGESKLMTEQWLASRMAKNVDCQEDENETKYTVFRPTGVYGPREKDYFLMVKSINNHYDFAVGFDPQQITFVYVKDLAKAILSAIDNEKAYGKTYAVSDGDVHSSRDFSDLIQKELDKRFVLHITAPLFLLKIVCNVGDWWSNLTGKISTLNKDKYNILSQRDWNCNITPIKEDLGYEPEYNLEKGVKETINWYKDNKWI